MLWALKKNVFRMATAGLEKGFHLTRYYMYAHLSQHKREWPDEARVLSISGSQRLASLLGFEDHQIVNVEYPDVNMLKLPFPDASFDAVVSDQVLEHLEGRPDLAFEEVFRVLRPGGLSTHTTCFLYQRHGAPYDYWRFTPRCLEWLVGRYSNVIDCGGWGNRAAVVWMVLGLHWFPVPKAKWHPFNRIATENDPDWPIVTWAVSEKPVELRPGVEVA